MKIRPLGTLLKLCVQMCFISPCHDPDKQSAASMYGFSCSRVIYMQHVSVIISSTESVVNKALLPTYTVQKSTNMGFSIVNVK